MPYGNIPHQAEMVNQRQCQNAIDTLSLKKRLSLLQSPSKRRRRVHQIRNQRENPRDVVALTISVELIDRSDIGIQSDHLRGILSSQQAILTRVATDIPNTWGRNLFQV